MTVTYLDQMASVVFDTNGNGTATLSIPVGSYWIPRFARVTTNIQTSPVARCTLYHGAVTVTSVGTYVDDTSLANSDSTSALAGGIAKWGEAITAVFSGGNPGDTGFLNVVGLYTDTLNEALEYLSVPGARFAGHIPTEILQTAATVPVSSPISVTTASNTVSIGPFDVRQWGSYYLKTYWQAASGTGTAFNPVEVDLNWFAKPGGSDVIYQDVIQWWADSSSGSFQFLGNPMEMQDIHHGPYMSVQFRNLAIADTLKLNYTLTFTTRTVPNPFYRQQSALNDILLDNNFSLVAGAAQVPLFFGYGGVQLELFNYSANPQNFFLGFGQFVHGTVGNVTDFLTTLPANGGLRIPNNQLIFPKVSALISVTGTGTDSFGIKAIANLTRV